MTEAARRLFCFGYGYSCSYLGYALMQIGGWAVAGTTRDPEKKAFMTDHGVKAYIFDYDKPLHDARLFLDGVTHLLVSTPPRDDGDPTFLMNAEEILQIPTLQWIGYLSSTCVYGDRGGDWVDERAELRPSSQRGTRRAIAEEQWLSLFEQHGLPVHIFRLAGIYGPGRSALDSVRTGVARRVEKPGHAFNRTHVEDIVNVLRKSMDHPAPGAIYNVCDDMPAPSHDVIAYACDLLGVEKPPLIPFEKANLAPIACSFYNDNKRIKNERIKQELGVELLYPTYKEGLTACLAAEENYAKTAE